ncbi:hypothetical protein [Vibrio cholerae]|uniref:O-antigen ligase family protein n=1 Tax=Vibrio cholerae TaxID=666 RepID=UPI00061903C5|nr:O-antigen ligase family protein [Vibrio cholerae]CFW14619.1 hypothetical protein [Vibrio cholerae]CPR25469.1 hypothetical protein [Vibrio cholerae]CPR25470.1 hypothetical protein [Vibrio cholerae]
MMRQLFLLAVALLSIAPVIVPFNVFSNINFGDLLLLMLSPFFIFKGSSNLRLLSFSPLAFMSVYLLSSSYALFVLDYVNDINVGFILRFFYYFLIACAISSFVTDQKSFLQVCKSILLGLTITLVLTWLVWSRTPVYLGSIPMLHTVHDFSIFPINRNYIGFFVALGSGLSLSLLIVERKTSKLLYVSLLFFFLLSSLLTFSKGTWLSSFIFPILYGIRRKPVLSGLLLCFSLVSVLFLYNAGDGLVFELIEKMTERVEGSGHTNSDRYEYAIDALFLGLIHFPFGVGAEGYLDAAIYNGFHPTKDPHNALLWVFAESGFVGLTLFIIVLFSLVFYIYKFAKHHESVLLLGLFVPLVLNIPFQGTPFSMKYLWVIIGLATSLRYISVEKNSSCYYRSSAGRS